MKKIIIWGGNKKSLNIETLDSYASVNAYFLTKYLKNDFEVINITDIDTPEEILNYKNIHSIIATSQYGFTNRLIKKGKVELYNKIRKDITGKLCSIADNNHVDKYYEDVLFCVRPVVIKYLNKSKILSNNANLLAIRCGWSAEPELFYPERLNEKDFNIFIDHAPYSLKVLNYVSKFHKVLKDIKSRFPNRRIAVYHQDDQGLVKWHLSNDDQLKQIYDRKIKVPYLDIADIYRKIHIFCFTHKESAGLSGIEAAMCGAKLYIPTDLFGRAFIKRDLLDKDIAYKIIYPTNYNLYNAFKKDIFAGINRENNHNKLRRTSHTWERAAEVIKRVIR